MTLWAFIISLCAGEVVYEVMNHNIATAMIFTAITIFNVLMYVNELIRLKCKDQQ